MFTSLKSSYEGLCLKAGAMLQAPTKRQAQVMMFAIGIALIAGGLTESAMANQGNGKTVYNDVRIADSTNAVLTYLEGSFGALVMVASGIGAILSAAFGQYRAALGLMVVAIGSFILRSLMSTFFNDTKIQQ